MAKKNKPKDKESKEKKTFDILKHILVPKHKILTKDEAEKVLKRYQISELQLPIIRVKDCVCKVIGAKSKDIIEITRSGPTGKNTYYRRVTG